METKNCELELVISNYIRNHYENKYNKQHIPMALKYLVIKFSNAIIGCKLLTLKEDLDFFNLLSTKLQQVRKFDLLFTASDHGYSAKRFHELCDAKGSTLTIIQSNYGNIFGGFASKSWTATNYTQDENAFLFLIRSNNQNDPKIFELDHSSGNQYAIFYNSSTGPCFGAGHDICISDKCNRKIACKSQHFETSLSYSVRCSYNTRDINISGSTTWNFQVIEYQVFAVKN